MCSLGPFDFWRRPLGLVVFSGRNSRVVSVSTVRTRALAAQHGISKYPATMAATEAFSNDPKAVVGHVDLHFAVSIVCGCEMVP